MNLYKMLAECLLPSNMLEWFDLKDVRVETKGDTKVIHITLDENDLKPDNRTDLRPNGFTRESVFHELRMIFSQRCTKEEGLESLRQWYKKVGEYGNKAFNDIAAAMYDREDEILNYFVNRSTNASAESLNAKIKQFRAHLRGES